MASSGRDWSCFRNTVSGKVPVGPDGCCCAVAARGSGSASSATAIISLAVERIRVSCGCRERNHRAPRSFAPTWSFYFTGMLWSRHRAEEDMSVSANLKRLIDTAAPYWAGEAEVFRTYWDWSQRTRETDRQWLSRQCSKEGWGSGVGATKGIFLGPAEELVAAFPKIDTEIDRHAGLDIAEGLWAEF